MKHFLLRWSLLPLLASTLATASAIVFTNDTLISPGDMNYDGSDVVISNCVVKMDGPHAFASVRVGPSGVLTHSASDLNSIPVFISIVDEPAILSGTNAVTLTASNVNLASVVVRDSSSTITYTNVLDYALGSSNEWTTLQRTETSAITDGSQVLVSYDYTNGTVTAGLFLTVDGNLDVDAGGAVNANGLGNSTVGAGQSSGSPLEGGGAGHGGYGGRSATNAMGGNSYGSPQQPTTTGSRGGPGMGGIGAAGGGLIRLSVAGTLQLNGSVSADGSNATNSRAGGGAGGGIWISATNFTGAGTITAHGGAGEPTRGGGGGGGRIAIYAETNSFNGIVLARGGTGPVAGGAGTVYIRTNSQPALLLLDNSGLSGTNTPLPGAINGEHLIVAGGAIAVQTGTSQQYPGSLLIKPQSQLIAKSYYINLALFVAGDAVIQSGGSINVDGAGYGPGSGTGPGGTYSLGQSTYGGGGGNAGYGGAGTNVYANGGNAYSGGSVVAPNTQGSGGGGRIGTNVGGFGGGVLYLNVNGKLQLDGSVSANGTPGTYYGGGGGSGGSVNLIAGTLAGGGSISAEGSNGWLPGGGGGGGGRVAIHCTTNLFTGTTSAAGGTGANAGGAGFVYTEVTNRLPEIVLDKKGRLGAAKSLMTQSGANNVAVTGGASLYLANGSQTYADLFIGSNSYVCSPSNYTTGITLTVNGSAEIQAGGGIIGDQNSYQSGGGPGGGSNAYGNGAGHGGYGGASSNGLAYPYGGNAYDSLTAPNMPGSGGGNYASSITLAGSGGSAIRLVVAGALAVNGILSANGGNAAVLSSQYYYPAGGGSGGSLWITAGTLTGSGAIAANGGSAVNSGGGGGGGRIAVFCATNSFTGNMSARGGAGYRYGGAGTIYTKLNSSPSGLVLLDNAGDSTATNTPVSMLTTDDLTIRSGSASLSPSTASFRNLLIESNATLRGSSLTINLSGGATIQAGGGIACDGGGGAFAGYGINYGTGGGYGGYGAGGSNGLSGGVTYGSVTAPNLPGSAGAPYGGGAGYGGGLIRLTVAGALVLDGKITANGNNAYAPTASQPLGGGSGGGIAITAGVLVGAGLISANGSSGLYGGGGGGGGRIAVNYDTNLFTGPISACGGPGYRGGGAGTIYLRQSSSGSALLLLDNSGLAGANTPVALTTGLDDLLVRGGAVAYATNTQSLRNLIIASNSMLTFPQSSSGPFLQNISGDATIQLGGNILADQLGSSSYSGSGYYDGGAGHGGFGGASSNLFSGGDAYGSITQPNTAGSIAYGGGGQGGGAIRLTIGGTLSLDGRISANGGASTNRYGKGGGSGGSIWLTAGTVIGNGTIIANGGNGTNGGGGGGGGRIAIYSGTNLFNGVMSASGGTGQFSVNTGGAGTIYTKVNGSPAGLLVVDNGGPQTRSQTPIDGISSDDLTTRGGGNATASGLVGIRHLRISTNSWLSDQGIGLRLTVSGDATVDPGGGILANGTAPYPGPGAGSYTNTPRGGGGHGGYGALNPPGSGGIYGSIVTPTNSGSSGGNGIGQPAYIARGGIGGGTVRLDVQNTLTVAGNISATGMAGDPNSGGGSGGSVWLTAETFAGNGTISANGGPGSGTGGGGGGGRVSLGYATNTFTGSVTTYGGTGGQRGGAGTIYTKATGSTTGIVTVDNGGSSGTNTPINSLDSSSFTLLAQNGGTVVFPTGSIPILGNLSVNAGGLITTLANQTNLNLAVTNNATISAGGAIVFDGCGYGQGTGAGAGAMSSNQGAGGGYGGTGGASLSGAAGGVSYGSAAQPVDRGSGGGAGSGPYAGGSTGGGAMRLTVGGTLALDGGTISANGTDGLQDDSGGGAGGSLWIVTRTLTGTNGVISADGGWGDLYGGGGGGGGRIAIYAPSNSFTGALSVTGGEGASFGQDGTLHLSTILPSFDVISQYPAGTLSNGVSHVEISFNNHINPDTLSALDVVVQTPVGILPQSSLDVYAGALSTLYIDFPLQTAPGSYSIQVGPQIEDTLGTPMSSVYTGGFTLVLPVIQGTVTDTNGQPVAGVVLQPSTGSPATTDASGHYTLGFEPGLTIDVTPAAAGLVFVPGMRTYTNPAVSLTGENYLAVPTIAPNVTGGASGTNLWLNWNGMAGVTYQAWWSTNLVNWLPYGNSIPGTNGPMNVLVPMDADPQKFYRIGAVN